MGNLLEVLEGMKSAFTSPDEDGEAFAKALLRIHRYCMLCFAKNRQPRNEGL